MATRRVPVAISLGDPSGIGPEVVAAALARDDVAAAVEPVVFGDTWVFSRGAKAMGVADRLPRVAAGMPVPRGGALVEITTLGRREAPQGRPTPAGGEAQGRFLEAAIAHVQAGRAKAICTAPISKAAIHAAGWKFPGHTEWLAERFGVRRVVMMLVGEPRSPGGGANQDGRFLGEARVRPSARPSAGAMDGRASRVRSSSRLPVGAMDGRALRVALATTHVSIRDLPDRLNAPGILETLRIVDGDLRVRFAIRAPKIAVCGLNPHAGEGGLFGDEEARFIEPAIRLAVRAGIRASGPHPADTIFPKAASGAFDAVLAMYHDQGLVPLKLLHFDTGVNVTLGLPIVRTSPDHGVAYDIAGTGRASASSMAEALLLAARMGRRA